MSNDFEFFKTQQPSYIWVSYGKEKPKRFGYANSSNLKVQECEGRFEVYCLHGDWYGYLMFDTEGALQALAVQEPHRTIKYDVTWWAVEKEGVTAMGEKNSGVYTGPSERFLKHTQTVPKMAQNNVENCKA